MARRDTVLETLAEMPKLLERCQEEFGTDNLYEVLCITTTANDSEGEYKTADEKVTRFRDVTNGCENHSKFGFCQSLYS